MIMITKHKQLNTMYKLCKPNKNKQKYENHIIIIIINAYCTHHTTRPNANQNKNSTDEMT